MKEEEIRIEEGESLQVDIGAGKKPKDTASPLEEIETAVAIANVSSVAQQPAMLSNLMFANTIANVNLAQANAVSNQQNMNEVGASVVGKVVNSITNLGPLEAMSALQILTGNEVAEELIDIKSAMALRS